MPKLSVNLVAYNGEKYISPCLSSVLAQNFRDFSVLIIDNGSKDGTRNELEKLVKVFKGERIEVNIIFLNENVGFAEGHNIGMVESQKSKACHGLAERVKSQKYVCCLNQDIILMPDYLAEIVEFMDAHSDCGSASGKLLRIDDEMFDLTPPASPFTKGGTMIIDSVGLKIFKSHRVIEKGRGEVDNGQYDRVEEVFGVPGTVPIYRIEALEDVRMDCGADCPRTVIPSGAEGSVFPKIKDSSTRLRLGRNDNYMFLDSLREYFDKDFFSYKEDFDLAYRLRWRDWKSFVVPDAVAYHKRSARQIASATGDIAAAFNRKNKSASVNYLSQRNHIWTLVKNVYTLNFAVIWYEAKKFGYELIFERSTFKAWIDAFKKLRVMRKKRQWIMESKKVKAEDINKWFQ